MNVSYRWLKEMVPGLDLDPDALAAHLALRGAPVEGIASPGAELGDVVVGKVLTAEQHPNADRLSLCTVDGGDGVVQVICGAPNVEAGRCYPFAPVGAVLPGGFKLKKAKIRGEVSQGMLCSAKELGLGTDHTGILAMEGEHTPGSSFVAAMGLDDATLDVEITTNRGDLLSHLGVARELASEGGGEVVLAALPGDPDVELTWAVGDPEARAGDVSIRIDDGDLCHRYLGAVIRGVKVGPSPDWLQARLRGAGARPINNVVDATNYVMLELGQPLHAFDLSRLGGSAIVVRRATREEATFTTLDDEERALTPDMLMICDAEEPVAIAGVMGGLHSEVDDATTDVLLECALFQPASIRNTRRALVMSTDASYRFERGVDPAGMRKAVERAVALILATAGGAVDGPVLDARRRTFEEQTVPLRLSRVEHLLGVPFEGTRVAELLEPLGFEVVGEEGGTLQVRVPGFRSYDVTREVDLIEEVARTHGYDAFPEALGPYRPNTVPDDALFRLQDEVAAALVARGFFEAHTPAFVGEGEGDVEVSNPLNTREPFMRQALLPSLVRRLEHNFARGNRDVRLFEMGTSFRKAASGCPPVETPRLAVAFAGRRQPPHWSAPDEAWSVWDLKDLLAEVAGRAWRAPVGLEAVPAGAPFAADAAFQAVTAEGAVVGRGGRLAADAFDAPPWVEAIWGVEINLPDPPAEAPVPVFEPLPQVPAVERDLALLLGAGVPAGAVADAVREGAGPLLEGMELFDVYEGEGLPAGTRSVAIRLRFRAPDRTLKDKEVDRTVAAVLRRLKEELRVEQRG